MAPPSTGKSLSSLLVNIFLPALNVKVFAANVTPAVLKEKSTLILASCVILAITFLLSPHLAKLFAKSPRQREVYTYAFTLPTTAIWAIRWWRRSSERRLSSP